jgi:hypothetical protein
MEDQIDERDEHGPACRASSMICMASGRYGLDEALGTLLCA